VNRASRGLVALACVPPLLLAAVALAGYLAGVTGVDTAAHAYKLDLLRHSLGSLFWDDLWYGGAYGIIDYGPLYYLIAAVVPAVLLVVLAAGSLPLLLHLYLRRVYAVGDYLPAAALAVVLCFYLVNGQDPFLVGLAFMLGGMVLLAHRRRAWAAAAIGAALFCNPLAVLTGGIFLAADVVARPDLRRDYAICGAWFLPFLVARVALTVLFRERAAYFD